MVSKLLSARAGDPSPWDGRFFTLIYETGDPGVRRVAAAAYRLFLDTDARDPLVFRSARRFERSILSWTARLVRAPEGARGVIASGEGESLLLALLAARERYYRVKGRDRAPVVLAPSTAGSSVRWAARVLGMRLVEAPVDPETGKATPGDVAGLITEETAVIVASAPNEAFGTIDDIAGLGELAMDHNVPLHVDAGIGGFLLPYMEEHGASLPAWAFDTPGVWSMNVDLHKYGYSPAGLSVVLFSDPEYYANAVAPGIGQAPLHAWRVPYSAVSVAPLAAAWAVIEYLGHDGYLSMTARILRARDSIRSGLQRLGLSPVHPVETSVLALASEEGGQAVLAYYAGMSRRGWILGLHPGIEGQGPLVHLTIAPVHAGVAQSFLADSEEAVAEEPPAWTGRDPMEALREIAASGTSTNASLLARALLALSPGRLDPEDLGRILDTLAPGEPWEG